MMQSSSRLRESTLKYHFDKLRSLYGYSKDQDIVVFIGLTGSGKSTLINYLNDKDMFINHDLEFQLRNPEDPTCMKIGLGGDSETQIPRPVLVDGMIFYDLPGLGDTGGTEINLINAAFIKHIMEYAKTVRFVFVFGEDEITGSRGETFKKLLRITQCLTSEGTVQQSSLFVVTKSTHDTIQKLIEFLRLKISFSEEDLQFWLDSNRILPMSRRIIRQQKENIMNKIKSLVPQVVKDVIIESLFNMNVNNDLRIILKLEMSITMEKIYKLYPKSKSTIKLIDNSIEYFSNTFKNDVKQDLDNSIIIQLMKPISPQIYFDESRNFQKEETEKINKTLYKLNKIKQNLENEEQKRQEQIKIQEEREAKIKLEASIAEKIRQKLEQKHLKIIEKAKRQEQIQQQERDRIAWEDDVANWTFSIKTDCNKSIRYGNQFFIEEKYDKKGLIFTSVKTRKSFYEKEIEVSENLEQHIRTQPRTEKIQVIKDWHVVSTSERETGEKRFVRNEE